MIVVVVLALVVPSLALAAGKPTNPGQSQDQHGKAAPKVMYVLKGTLSAYTAANGSTDGAITIKITRANRHGMNLKVLKGDTLTFAVSSSTKIVLHNGAAIADGDSGIVKVRGPKSATAFAAATDLKAFQVIDQGAAQEPKPTTPAGRWRGVPTAADATRSRRCVSQTARTE